MSNHRSSTEPRLWLALSAMAVVASSAMLILKRRKWTATKEVEKRKAYRDNITRSTLVGSNPIMVSTSRMDANDQRKNISSISMLTSYYAAPEPIITAVILHGMGCTSLEFNNILTQLKEKRNDVNIFCYDRVLFVRDDDSINTTNNNTSRDARTLAMELHTLLQNRNVAPPYLLIGHSYGGLVAQYFASLYVEETKGMVLMDPAHEHQQQCFPKDFGSQFTILIPLLFKLYEKIAWTGFLQLLDQFGLFNFPPIFLFRNSPERKTCVKLYSIGCVWKRAALELDGFLETANQMNSSSSSNSSSTTGPTTDDTIRQLIHTIPTALVIANHRQYTPTLFPKAVTKAFLDMHEMSLPNAKVFLADQSDHWIHMQQPDVVMEAVNFVLNERKK